MELVVDSDSYNEAVGTIIALLGAEVDCILRVKDGKARIEASNPEAYLNISLKLESCEGEGAAFTKVEYLKIVHPKTKTMKLSYEGEDHISVSMGRARGGIRVLAEDDVDVERPEEPVKIEAIVPAKLVVFATGATAFKPLIDASSPNALIHVSDKEFNISSYDTYIGTHYGTTNEEVRTKRPFSLTVEMDFWHTLITKMGKEGFVKMGADERYFRIKTETFDLYHAMMQEDSQNVKEVIDNLRSTGEHLAVVEFDGNAVTDAIDSTKGIIRSADKDGAQFFITLKKEGIAILSAESVAGEIEADFDIDAQINGDEDIEFRVSADTFADTLKLTRDEGLKYGRVRMTVLSEYLIMESLKVPAASISPVLQE